jgi:hypothetical protein
MKGYNMRLIVLFLFLVITANANPILTKAGKYIAYRASVVQGLYTSNSNFTSHMTTRAIQKANGAKKLLTKSGMPKPKVYATVVKTQFVKLIDVVNGSGKFSTLLDGKGKVYITSSNFTFIVTVKGRVITGFNKYFRVGYKTKDGNKLYEATAHQASVIRNNIRKNIKSILVLLPEKGLEVGLIF